MVPADVAGTDDEHAGTDEGAVRAERPAPGVLLADEERDAPLRGEGRGHHPLRGRRGVRPPGVAQHDALGQPAGELLRTRAEQLHQPQPRQGVEEPVVRERGAARARHPDLGQRGLAGRAGRRRGRTGGRGAAGRPPPRPRRWRGEGTSTCRGSSGSRGRCGTAPDSRRPGPRAGRTYCEPGGTAGGTARPRLLAALLTAVVLAGCGGDGYEPSGPFRPLPEGAPPEVGPPSSSPRRPRRARPNPESGEEGGDPNVVASGLAVPDGPGRAARRQRDRRRAGHRAAAAGLPRPLARPRADDGAGHRHRGRRRAAGAGALAHLRRGRPALRLRLHRDRQPGGALPAGRHAEPGAHRHPPRRDAQRRRPAVRPRRQALRRHRRHRGPALAADPASLAGKVLRIDVFGAPVGDPGLQPRAPRRDGAVPVGGEDAAGVLTPDRRRRRGPDELDLVTEGGDHGRRRAPARRGAADGGRPGRLRRRRRGGVPRRAGRRSGCTSSRWTAPGRPGATRSEFLDRRSTAGCDRRPRRRGRAVDHHVQPGRRRHARRGRRQGAAGSCRRRRPARSPL